MRFTWKPSGRRSPGVPSRVVALALAVLAVGAALLTARGLGGGRAPDAGAVATRRAAKPDPHAVCDVPAYDPDVVLIGEDDPFAYPREVLEGPGEPASEIEGPAADALRETLATPGQALAPEDGWRVLREVPRKVVYAAPSGPREWWLIVLGVREGEWREVGGEIADERPTPAQLGHGIRLEWSGPLVSRDGTWDAPLWIVNDRDERWTVEDIATWATPHLFDRETGDDVRPDYRPYGGIPLSLAPGERAGVPVALGGLLGDADPGSYDVVACIPALGLASPVGTAHLGPDPTVAGAAVLTRPFEGYSMGALAHGRLSLEGGCLALDPGGGSVSFLVLPDGYALVARGDREVVIDPVGEELGALGDAVSLGGGHLSAKHVDGSTIEPIPTDCRASGHGYFFSSGSS